MILDGNSKPGEAVVYKNTEDFLLKKLAQFLKVVSSSQPERISISFIQRKLRLGYNDASSLLSFLVEEKLVTNDGFLLLWINLPEETDIINGEIKDLKQSQLSDINKEKKNERIKGAIKNCKS